MIAGALLRLMALNYNQRPGLREWLRSDGGWLDFSVGFRTEGNGMHRAIVFEDGRARVTREVPGGGPDVTLVFPRDDAVRKMISVPPNEVMNMLMKNELHIEGNLTYMNLFNYYLSLLMKKKNRRTVLKLRERDARERSGASPAADRELAGEMGKRKREMLRGPRVDPGVIHLEDPYLSSFSLSDFPRLGKFLDIHFNTEPEICRERLESRCCTFLPVLASDMKSPAESVRPMTASSSLTARRPASVVSSRL